MLRPLFGLAASGVVAILLWKLLAVLLVPLAAMALGFLVFAIKFVFVAAAILFAVWLFRRWTRAEASPS
jgi:hypothetical protein